MEIRAVSKDLGDGRVRYAVFIDGKRCVDFADGESEDNSLTRNFSDVFMIPYLLQRAYDAGRAGDEFSIEEVTRADDET